MGAPIPWQQFAKPPLRESGDAGEHIGKPSLWIDIIKLGRHDQRGHDRGAVGSAIGACKEPGFSPQRNRPFILPMSGRKWKFITDGIRILDARSAFAVWSNGRPACS
jgi:hypothetical protein